MTSLVKATTVAADGTASISIYDVPTGLEWVVSQVTVEVNLGGVVPTHPISAYIRQNGRLLSATNQGGAGSAGGYPFFTIKPGDKFVISWASAPPTYSAIATIYYNERVNGTTNIVGVV